jgi:uncharacterized membrane protein
MNEPTVTERWWGASCYVSALVVLPILMVENKGEFLARHCRQGFTLLAAEVVLLLVLGIVDASLGRIPLIGMLLSVILHLVGLLTCLGISALGFAKALTGESWHLPFLDEFAARVPIH